MKIITSSDSTMLYRPSDKKNSRSFTESFERCWIERSTGAGLKITVKDMVAREIANSTSERQYLLTSARVSLESASWILCKVNSTLEGLRTKLFHFVRIGLS